MATEQKGLVAGNAQNKAGGVTPRSRSTFPLSYSFFETERFADLTPFFVAEGVSGDRLPLHSNHEVQTYTLKSPILQDLMKKKDYFMVPMQSILPRNWEKFYTNPNIGEDVPVDCGTGVAEFWSQLKIMFDADYALLNSTLASTSVATGAERLDALFHFLLFYEMFYSTGSLMETLGISGHNFFRGFYQPSVPANSPLLPRTFDEIFDSFMSWIVGEMEDTSVNLMFLYQVGGNNYRVVLHPSDFASNLTFQEVTLREALEMMRDDLSFTITTTYGWTSAHSTSLKSRWDDFGMTALTNDAPLNLARLWAYQLVQAHFYSNDHVDFIYSAELFRQYVEELVTRNVTTSGVPQEYLRTFSVNGLNYTYDALSATYCRRLLYRLRTGILDTYSTSGGANVLYPDSKNDCLAYFVACFQFKKSLRFMDYFTGSRAYPLAMASGTMGNGTMSSSYTISGNTVDIVELSKHSKATQFLQAVNRSGRKFSAYMKELFGIVPKYDFHNPMYLAHVSDLVGSPQTENTGVDQLTKDNSVTSRFRATSSRYAFEFQPDRDCIVIGISYYDLPRVYTRATERQNFNLDRFDMFNPFLQYTGDQGIYEAEIGTDTPLVSSNFSYTNKDMQYKQRFNQACGGFCIPSTGLDHWLFVADKKQRRDFHHISPSFIRSFNSEIDDFFVNLTGYSLGTYFHFITRYDNRMNASRPMAYAPAIEV